jgi:hypothetical protein
MADRPHLAFPAGSPRKTLILEIEKPAYLKIGVSTKQRPEVEEPKKEKPKKKGYENPVLEAKRQIALQELGTWYKHGQITTYQARGEHFLTFYHRVMVQRRLTVTIISGSFMLGAELKKLVQEVVKDDSRLYVGDIKILGEQEKR